MGSFGESFKSFFINSNSKVLQALGHLLHFGIHSLDGLNDAVVMKRAHLESRKYLELTIAQHYLEADGTSSLYVGKENIIPSTNAWPIPHDAPFKPAVDSKIMAIIEAGLYEQWKKEIIEDVARASRVRKRKEVKAQQQQKKDGQEGRGSMSLTITHVQGPLLLLLLGLTLGGLVSVVEIFLVPLTT